MPKSMLNQAQDGVLVMKIDLSDPERKSVVMSTKEFSQEEDHVSALKLPAKRKKKGSKRNNKQS